MNASLAALVNDANNPAAREAGGDAGTRALAEAAAAMAPRTARARGSGGVSRRSQRGSLSPNSCLAPG